MSTPPHLADVALIAAGATGHSTLEAIAITAGICIAVTPVLVVLAAVMVLVWHGLRGTDPGPAGLMLITLVRLVLPLAARKASTDRDASA
jgi:hypothetical protein